MEIQTTKEWLDTHLQNITYIPQDLVKHISQASRQDTNHPWWLAERVVKVAVEDKDMESNILLLMQTIERSIQNKTFLEDSFEMIENVIDIMSCAFKLPSLKNAFNTENAFVTVYYVIIFIMSCALGEDRNDNEIVETIREYEKIILSVASMANKLLLNNEVYEFVVETAESCLSRGRILC